MIRCTLIHFLLNSSLNLLFDSIFDNFQIFSFDSSKYDVGDYLKIKIGLKYKELRLDSCIIESKAGDDIVILSNDFKTPIRIYVSGNVINDIQGDFSSIFNNMFI